MWLLSDFVGQVSFQEFQAFLEEAATTEGRLVISGVILLVTLLVALLLIPYAIRASADRTKGHLPEGRATGLLELLEGYIPTTVGDFVVRTVQVAILGVATLALLIVWGLVDIAWQILLLIGISLPLVRDFFLTVVVLLFAFVVADLLQETVKELGDDANRVTDHQQEIMVRMGNLGILALAVTTILTIWGLNLSGLLVGAGFLGIVVGMAARQTLGSMIAGFVLMFSRPFTIGDWVQVGEHEGIVTNITIMNTRMKNFDGESIIIPNDNVSNKAVTNRSEQGHLRIRLEVGIDYEDDPDHAEEVAVEVMEQVESIADSPPPSVVPTGFGDSAILLELRFWIDRPAPPRRWRATRAVIHDLKTRFEKEGIGIPFPQRTLSGRPDAAEFRVSNSTGRPPEGAPAGGDRRVDSPESRPVQDSTTDGGVERTDGETTNGDRETTDGKTTDANTPETSDTTRGVDSNRED